MGVFYICVLLKMTLVIFKFGCPVKKYAAFAMQRLEICNDSFWMSKAFYCVIWCTILFYRFSPAIFCYLLSSVPSIWLLEINLSQLRVQPQNISNNQSTGIQLIESVSKYWYDTATGPLRRILSGGTKINKTVFIFRPCCFAQKVVFSKKWSSIGVSIPICSAVLQLLIVADLIYYLRAS